MNVLDRLKEKNLKQAEHLTALEKLILTCGDAQIQLQAAAELHELQAGHRVYDNSKDLSELKTRQV